jgi:hypothetical protein
MSFAEKEYSSRICYIITAADTATIVNFAFVSAVSNVPILTISHIPNLTFYVPDLTGASNVLKIEQCPCLIN